MPHKIVTPPSRDLPEHWAVKRNSKKIKVPSERGLVRKVVDTLRAKYGKSIYIFIDQDSPDRRFTSPWDFFISYDGKIVFVEAKMGKNKLTDFQKVSQMEIEASGGAYYIMRFWADSEEKNLFGVVIERNEQIHTCPITDVTLESFMF